MFFLCDMVYSIHVNVTHITLQHLPILGCRAPRYSWCSCRYPFFLATSQNLIPLQDFTISTSDKWFQQEQYISVNRLHNRYEYRHMLESLLFMYKFLQLNNLGKYPMLTTIHSQLKCSHSTFFSTCSLIYFRSCKCSHYIKLLELSR